MKRRVLITGMGVISAIGTGKQSFLEGLKTGKDGVTSIPYFDTSDYALDKAAIVEGFDESDYKMKDSSVETERANVYALHAAKEAVIDSGLDFSTIDHDMVGVSLATSLASFAHKDVFNSQVFHKGYEGADPTLMMDTCSTAAGVLAKEYDAFGPSVTISTACASGSNSIGCAYDLISDGTCDIMITGGVDPFSRLSYSGFLSLHTISKTTIRPFDETREGIDIGEGAAILILEDMESALKRGAHIYAEVLGYGISNDAYHATSPDPMSGGAIRAINMCLDQAGIQPEDINYINAHGTGTRFNDQMELRAIKTVFGESAKNIPVSSTKSLMGHTLGCAGSIEALTCALAISEGILPPTIKTKEPMHDAEGMDFVLDLARSYQIEKAISTSFAFGGNTAVIAIGRYN